MSGMLADYHDKMSEYALLSEKVMLGVSHGFIDTMGSASSREVLEGKKPVIPSLTLPKPFSRKRCLAMMTLSQRRLYKNAVMRRIFYELHREGKNLTDNMLLFRHDAKGVSYASTLSLPESSLTDSNGSFGSSTSHCSSSKLKDIQEISNIEESREIEKMRKKTLCSPFFRLEREKNASYYNSSLEEREKARENEQSAKIFNSQNPPSSVSPSVSSLSSFLYTPKLDHIALTIDVSSISSTPYVAFSHPLLSTMISTASSTSPVCGKLDECDMVKPNDFTNAKNAKNAEIVKRVEHGKKSNNHQTNNNEQMNEQTQVQRPMWSPSTTVASQYLAMALPSHSIIPLFLTTKTSRWPRSSTLLSSGQDTHVDEQMTCVGINTSVRTPKDSNIQCEMTVTPVAGPPLDKPHDYNDYGKYDDYGDSDFYSDFLPEQFQRVEKIEKNEITGKATTMDKMALYTSSSRSCVEGDIKEVEIEAKTAIGEVTNLNDKIPSQQSPLLQAFSYVTTPRLKEGQVGSIEYQNHRTFLTQDRLQRYSASSIKPGCFPAFSSSSTFSTSSTSSNIDKTSFSSSSFFPSESPSSPSSPLSPSSPSFPSPSLHFQCQILLGHTGSDSMGYSAIAFLPKALASSSSKNISPECISYHEGETYLLAVSLDNILYVWDFLPLVPSSTGNNIYDQNASFLSVEAERSVPNSTPFQQALTHLDHLPHVGSKTFVANLSIRKTVLSLYFPFFSSIDSISSSSHISAEDWDLNHAQEQDEHEDYYHQKNTTTASSQDWTQNILIVKPTMQASISLHSMTQRYNSVRAIHGRTQTSVMSSTVLAILPSTRPSACHPSVSPYLRTHTYLTPTFYVVSHDGTCGVWEIRNNSLSRGAVYDLFGFATVSEVYETTVGCTTTQKHEMERKTTCHVDTFDSISENRDQKDVIEEELLERLARTLMMKSCQIVPSTSNPSFRSVDSPSDVLMVTAVVDLNDIRDAAFLFLPNNVSDSIGNEDEDITHKTTMKDESPVDKSIDSFLCEHAIQTVIVVFDLGSKTKHFANLHNSKRKNDSKRKCEMEDRNTTDTTNTKEEKVNTIASTAIPTTHISMNQHNYSGLVSGLDVWHSQTNFANIPVDTIAKTKVLHVTPLPHGKERMGETRQEHKKTVKLNDGISLKSKVSKLMPATTGVKKQMNIFQLFSNGNEKRNDDRKENKQSSLSLHLDCTSPIVTCENANTVKNDSVLYQSNRMCNEIQKPNLESAFSSFSSFPSTSLSTSPLFSDSTSTSTTSTVSPPNKPLLLSTSCFDVVFFPQSSQCDFSTSFPSPSPSPSPLPLPLPSPSRLCTVLSTNLGVSFSSLRKWENRAANTPFHLPRITTMTDTTTTDLTRKRMYFENKTRLYPFHFKRHRANKLGKLVIAPVMPSAWIFIDTNNITTEIRQDENMLTTKVPRDKMKEYKTDQYTSFHQSHPRQAHTILSSKASLPSLYSIHSSYSSRNPSRTPKTASSNILATSIFSSTTTSSSISSLSSVSCNKKSPLASSSSNLPFSSFYRLEKDQSGNGEVMVAGLGVYHFPSFSSFLAGIPSKESLQAYFSRLKHKIRRINLLYRCLRPSHSVKTTSSHTAAVGITDSTIFALLLRCDSGLELERALEQYLGRSLSLPQSPMLISPLTSASPTTNAFTSESAHNLNPDEINYHVEERVNGRVRRFQFQLLGNQNQREAGISSGILQRERMIQRQFISRLQKYPPRMWLWRAIVSSPSMLSPPLFPSPYEGHNTFEKTSLAINDDKNVNTIDEWATWEYAQDQVHCITSLAAASIRHDEKREYWDSYDILDVPPQWNVLFCGCGDGTIRLLTSSFQIDF